MEDDLGWGSIRDQVTKYNAEGNGILIITYYAMCGTLGGHQHLVFLCHTGQKHVNHVVHMISRIWMHKAAGEKVSIKILYSPLCKWSNDSSLTFSEVFK